MIPLALVNPAAGGGRAGRLARTVLEDFGPLDVRQTMGPGHATALVRAARERGVHRFLSVGGDGTLHEVVTGALAVEGPPPVIGLCPLGTGNSFGKDVDVLDLPSALAAWKGGHLISVDALRLTSKEAEPLYAINLVGLGFSARAGDLTNRRFKALGALGYIAAVLVELARLSSPRIAYSIDGVSHDEDVVMLSLCNSRYTGGDMCMAPLARIDDGLLDVIRLGPLTRPRFLTAFPRIFAGTHPEMPEIDARTARVVEFDGEERLVMIDGEVVPLALQRVEVVPSAVEVLCPR